MKTLALAASTLLLAAGVADAAPAKKAAAPKPAPMVEHIYGTPTAAIASLVTVPAGYVTYYFSGVLPAAPAAGAMPGDAEAQALNVFTTIGENLKAKGLTEADVVHMTIYMRGDGGKPMDFAGMMKSYSKFYGSPTQMNRPSRSTVQVAALARADALLEVEVTAVGKPK